MASMSNIEITFEIEPIVKVTCMAISCKHNLWRVSGAHCNLKNIVISKEAYGRKCEQFEKREDEADNGQS